MGTWLASDWQWIGDGLDWHWIGNELAPHWKWIGRLVQDSHWLGKFALDWQWIGIGLALHWHRIGTGLAEKNRGFALDWCPMGWINNGLAMDWSWIGDRLILQSTELAMHWHKIGTQLTSDLHMIGCRLTLDWHRIGNVLALHWQWIGLGDGLAYLPRAVNDGVSRHFGRSHIVLVPSSNYAMSVRVDLELPWIGHRLTDW